MASDSPTSDEIQRFEEQYERQPESLVFARLADAYRKAGQPEKALALLDDGLLRHPDYPSGHIVRARALRDLGRMEETLDSFRKVLELDGHNLVAISELAGLAEERGDLGEARHWYERLAQADPTNPEAGRRVAELETAAVHEEVAESDEPETPVWWDDSAVDREVDPVDGPEPVDDSFWGAEGGSATPASEALPTEDDRRPEDEVVEAILNGDVPRTVKVEDTWWYEEAPREDGPEPSRDADLLTRTMADLYAEQGLHREAAEIYAELLKDSPDDPDLLARVEALRDKRSDGQTGSSDEVAVQTGEEWVEDSVPLAPSTGPPVTTEIRRLLRMGEERASELPDPEIAESDRGDEAPPDREADPETATLSPFAREWIRRLESGA